MASSFVRSTKKSTPKGILAFVIDKHRKDKTREYREHGCGSLLKASFIVRFMTGSIYHSSHFKRTQSHDATLHLTVTTVTTAVTVTVILQQASPPKNDEMQCL